MDESTNSENTDTQVVVRPVGGTADVRAAIKCGRNKIYDLMANDPTFPRPWNMGRELRWFMDEIEDWKASRPRRQYRVGDTR